MNEFVHQLHNNPDLTLHDYKSLRTQLLEIPQGQEGKASQRKGIIISAQKLEALVINQLCDWLTNTDAIIHALNPESEKIQHLLTDAQKLANDLQDNRNQQYQLLGQIIDHVEVNHDHVSVFVKVTALTITDKEQSPQLITDVNIK